MHFPATLKPDFTIPVDKITNSKKSPQLRELKARKGAKLKVKNRKL